MVWTLTFREGVVVTVQVHGVDTPSGKWSLLQHRYMVWALTFREGVAVTAQVHDVDIPAWKLYSTGTWCVDTHL